MRLLPICIFVSLCLAQTPPPAGNGQTHPSVISKTDPIYSEEARRAHIQSSVLLSIVVNANGTAEDIRVLTGAGFGLDERAVESVEKWHFNPGTFLGGVVKVRAQVAVNFNFSPGPVKSSQPRTRLNFKLSQGVTRPQLISGTMPQDLPGSGHQDVNLSLAVDTDGAINSLNVLNSTDPEWDARIRKALEKWKFSPATQNGQPIPAEGILVVSSPTAVPVH